MGDLEAEDMPLPVLFPIETTQIGTVMAEAIVKNDLPNFFRVYWNDPHTGNQVDLGEDFVKGLNDTVKKMGIVPIDSQKN